MHERATTEGGEGEEELVVCSAAASGAANDKGNSDDGYCGNEKKWKGKHKWCCYCYFDDDEPNLRRWEDEKEESCTGK